MTTEQAILLLVNVVIIFGLFSYVLGLRYSRNFYKKKLENLAKKNQTEQELCFATTEQLIIELTKRMPNFVMLFPISSNKNEETMRVHIKGLEPAQAIMAMQMASAVIISTPPTRRHELTDE